MWRALRFLLIATVLLAAIWAVASIPGSFTAESGAYTVQSSVPAAILLLGAVALLLALLVRLLGNLRRAPGALSGWRLSRRLQNGEAALERGILALAAGDAAAAEREAASARSLLGDRPLVLMLVGEAARLAGKPTQANAAFEQLTHHPRFGFLGHRGLLRHHLASGAVERAELHARAAEDAYPGSPWTRRQRFEIALKAGDYEAALRFAQTRREITAMAIAAADTAPNSTLARRYAKQAAKASPGFAPAIMALVNAWRRTNRARAARRAIAKGWAKAPHPMLAAAWLDGISAPLERAQAAEALARRAPGHPESELFLAQTALAAQLPVQAARHARAAIQAGLADQRAQAILAQLDPADAATASVALAAPAPVWRCDQCGAESAAWTPICPACGHAGTLTWTTARPAALLPSNTTISV